MMGDRVNAKVRVPNGAARLFRSFLAAGLTRELRACGPKRRDWISVDHHRVVVEELSEYHLFRVPPGRVEELRVGSRILLELEGRRPLFARLVAKSEEGVTLGLREALTGPVPPGRIAPDSRWIHHCLRACLLAGLSGHDTLALEMLGFPVRRPRVSDAAVSLPGDLNHGQASAVLEAVRPGVLVLNAGPGTGKTHTIAALSAVLASLERRVLIVAPSNRAADEAAMAVCGRLQSHPEFGDGLVLRYGRSKLVPLEQAYGPAIDPVRIAVRQLSAMGNSDPTPDELGQVVDDLVREAPVVISTVAQTWLSRRLTETGFHTVVVDEAGMMSLPSAYYVATVADHSLVIAGDRLQLPPVTRSRQQVARTFFGTGPLDVSATDESGAGPRTVTLRDQHRMDGPILGLANGLTYRGVLRAGPALGMRASLRGPSLILVDSVSESPQPGGRRGHGNPCHARLVARILHRYTGPESDESRDVLVLSRFREQVQLLRSALPDWAADRAMTIHAAQGGEAHTVVLDLCYAPGGFRGDYLEDGQLTSTGARLLNVAITRARRRLVVVANVPLLREVVPEDAKVRDLLNYLTRHGSVMSPADFPLPDRAG